MCTLCRRVAPLLSPGSASGFNLVIITEKVNKCWSGAYFGVAGVGGVLVTESILVREYICLQSSKLQDGRYVSGS